MRIVLLILGLGIGAAGMFLARDLLWRKETTEATVVPDQDAELKRLRAQISELQAKIQRLETEKGTLASAESAPVAEASEAPEGESRPDLNQAVRAFLPFVRGMMEDREPERKERVARMIDSAVAELTRTANLTPEQAAAFKAHLEQLDQQNQAKWKSALDSKDANLASIMEMGRSMMNPQKSVDEWAEANLSGEQKTAYTTKRLTDKAKRITATANAQVERMGRDLNLDESQKDKLFTAFVRTSDDYDPAMQIEGVSTPVGGAPAQSRDEAIAAILTPEQNQKYQSQRERGRNGRERWMRMLGMDPTTQGGQQ